MKTMPAPQQKSMTKDELILEHLPLVTSISVRVHERVPQCVDLDDLIQAGTLGLIDAASKFDAKRHIEFRYYAKHRIRGAILDSLRQMDWRSRDVRRQQRVASDAIRVMAQELQRTPSEEEMAGHLGLSVSKWRRVAGELHHDAPLSVTTEEGSPDADIADQTLARPDQSCAAVQLRSALQKALQRLPQRQQTVIELYYGEEKTMADIGRVLGVNESRVSQMHKAAIVKLGAALREMGIDNSDAFEVVACQYARSARLNAAAA